MVNYATPNETESLIRTPRLLKSGLPSKNDEDDVIKLDQLYITSDKKKFFSGMMEIIYQVRNMLVNGKMNPEKNEHDVVKYCYRILWALMT